MSNYRPLLDLFTEGHRLPRGYDRLLLKATRPDLRTKNGFRWKMRGRVESPEPGGGRERTTGVCPRFPGDGLSLAKTALGMAQGDYSPSTVLIVAVRESDVLAEDEHKVRVLGGFVVDLTDGLALIRTNGERLHLQDANLQSANLRGAYLQDADLQDADLQDVILWDAHLQGANLQGADLQGANLRDADLRDVDLWDADLRGANLQGARAAGNTVWPTGFDPVDRGVIVI